MYTLYYAPATASMAVHLALLETGASYELQLLDFEKNQQKDPAYLRLNPNGVVPTLVCNGKPYIETAALMMLLAERHPAAGLAGTPEQYDEWRQWMIYLSHNLQATYRFWFYPSELGYATHPDEVRHALQMRIEKIWDQLDQHLNAHGPYLLGAQFSVADLYLTVLMRWSRNMPHPATEWPALNHLVQLITNRPSWKKMMEIEGVDIWPEDKTV